MYMTMQLDIDVRSHARLSNIIIAETLLELHEMARQCTTESTSTISLRIDVVYIKLEAKSWRFHLFFSVCSYKILYLRKLSNPNSCQLSSPIATRLHTLRLFI